RLDLPTGSTFLLLEDASYVKSGDYLLVGRRLKLKFRQAPNPPPPQTKWFDTHAPWLTGEVVQALEVQGNLVRIKDPISQNFYEDRLPNGGDVLTEIVVVPNVTSVYYSDYFTQEVVLPSAEEDRTFIVPPGLDARYVLVKINPGLDP